MPIKLSPYRLRQVAFQRIITPSDWQLKLYHISRSDSTQVTQAIEQAAIETASEFLTSPRPPHNAAGIDWNALENYRVGSLIVHPGSDAIFAVLDYWIGENMFVHQAWAAPINDPTKFESISESGVCMCVWELAVIQHERAAWIKHVYNPQASSDVNAYLADSLSTEI